MAPRRELKDFLTHRDPSQLWFQLAEIVGDRTYLKNGIEVGPGDVVIDAGANVGVAAAFFLSDCGAAEVHSFEPVPAIHEMLVANMETLPGSRTYMFGLSDTDGETGFTYYDGAAAMSSQYADPARDHESVKVVLGRMGLSDEECEDRLAGDFDPERIVVRMRRLSSVIEEQGIGRIDLLKVDVERAELDVLRGLDDQHWPLVRQVVAEVHDENGRLDEIRALLESHGFGVTVDQEDRLGSSGIFVLYARRV